MCIRDSTYIGLSTSTAGIELSDSTNLVKFQSGLISNGPTVYSIRRIFGTAQANLLESDCILLLNVTILRGSVNNLDLGLQTAGKTIYLRRIDDNSVTPFTIQVNSGGEDFIRLSSTSSVTSFNIAQDEAWTLTYDADRATWFAIRNGGSLNYVPGPPVP